MTIGYMLRVGDKTMCGGTILTGSPIFKLDGKPAATEGSKVTCGVYSGEFVILGGINRVTSPSGRIAGTLDSISSCPCNSKFTPSAYSGIYQNNDINHHKKNEFSLNNIPNKNIETMNLNKLEVVIKNDEQSINNDILKMRTIFKDTMILMNERNLRRNEDSFLNGYINNMSSSFYSASGGVMGDDFLGCEEQAQFMMLSLKDEKYLNNWSFSIVGIYVHYWVEATYKDRKIKIDPWRNVFEGVNDK